MCLDARLLPHKLVNMNMNQKDKVFQNSEGYRPKTSSPITCYWLEGVPDNNLLLAGRVPDNNLLLTGSVPDNNMLLARRVPDNNFILITMHRL